MRKLLLIALCAALPAFAQPKEELVQRAASGDYDAQRNLAFSYSTGSSGLKLDPVKGCAWYLVVLRSERAVAADAGNVLTYCGADKLGRSGDALAARLSAERDASAFLRQVRAKK